MLSASYHNVMGYYRRYSAQELVLDEKAAEGDRTSLWNEFDFIAEHTARTWVQYFFNQSGEVYGKGDEGARRDSGWQRSHYEPVILKLKADYLAKGRCSSDE